MTIHAACTDSLNASASRQPVEARPRVPAATAAEIMREVAAEALTEHTLRWPRLASVRYVPQPTPGSCPAPDLCHPLRQPIASDIEGPIPVAHLHRDPTAPERDDDRTATTSGRRSPAADDMAAVTAILVDLIDTAVTRDLLACTAAAERRRADDLTRALESNRTIGMAIGVVMATRKVTGDQAFDLLRRASQNQNRKLRDLAADVLYTGVPPTPTPGRRPRPAATPRPPASDAPQRSNPERVGARLVSSTGEAARATAPAAS